MSYEQRFHFAEPMAAGYQDYQRQRNMTIGDLLLDNRVVFLQGEITNASANELVMKLLYLQSANRRKDINFYINSPGGSVSATLAILDTMNILVPQGITLGSTATVPICTTVWVAVYMSQPGSVWV